MTAEEDFELDCMIEQEQLEQWLLDEALAEEDAAMERLAKESKQ